MTPTGGKSLQPFAEEASTLHFQWAVIVRQPLGLHCKTIGDIRRFLTGCRYVSDQELFGKRDYWQPPEDFETRRKGDCEDFALWTWRQLLNMGYDARFVGGSAGRYGEGHAWVEYFQDGKCFLLEPLYSRVGPTMPRLSTVGYEPRISVSWDGQTLRYFAHRKPNARLELRVLAALIPEYLIFGTSFWVRMGFASLGLFARFCGAASSNRGIGDSTRIESNRQHPGRL